MAATGAAGLPVAAAAAAAPDEDDTICAWGMGESDIRRRFVNRRVTDGGRIGRSQRSGGGASCW